MKNENFRAKGYNSVVSHSNSDRNFDGNKQEKELRVIKLHLEAVPSTSKPAFLGHSKEYNNLSRTDFQVIFLGSRFRAMVLQRGTTLDYSVGLMILEEVINGLTLVVDIKKCDELNVSPMEKDWLTLFGHREMRTYHDRNLTVVTCHIA
ncbi:hypothetical protein Sjap_015308 [Stephania japonica]|uniref:Uncharacterized protein n=1 Tax=Stephania japonica TaxID=461633 RepID=A0AAP0IIV6_9MAGN